MLEYDDVMRIILATNRHDYPDPKIRVTARVGSTLAPVFRQW